MLIWDLMNLSCTISRYLMRYITDIINLQVIMALWLVFFFSFIDCRGSPGNLLELDMSLKVF